MTFIFTFPYDLEDYQRDLAADSGNQFLEELRNQIKS